jgi:dTDP-4-dehydrorhamnose 3,5-epimerase
VTATTVTGAVLEPFPAVTGVLVARPTVHRDGRGRFVETYRAEWFPGQAPMIQGNHAERQAGSVVGLHYHERQTDYWYVVRGHARAVVHDLRVGSPTEGATATIELGEVYGADHNHLGLLIPRGVAHGIAAISDISLTYLVDATYDPGDELGVVWDDPDVGADWGIDAPVLSERDQALPHREAIPADRRPRFPTAS